MAFLKPQNPMTKGSDYFYPLTTADQVIMDGGYRLNDIVGKVKKSTITLYANGWSVEVPHCYSVIVDGLSNNTDMKILPRFPEDFESKQIMREETAKISFASRNNNILTFECWDEIPTIDIPIDIEINILYPSMPDIQLNYSVVGGTIEPENPSENMIWVNTENEITSHKLSKYEPNNPVEGMVWIHLDDASNVHFHTLSMNERELDEVYPLSAKQYVGGAWVDVEAKSYQNGEWVDWVESLYDSGVYSVPFENWGYTNGLVENKTDYVNIGNKGSQDDSQISWTSVEKMDLNQYRKAYCEAICTFGIGTVNNVNWDLTFGAFTSKAKGRISPTQDMVVGARFTADSTRRVYELDIPSNAGECYVGVQGIGKAQIFKCWLV